MDLRLNPEAGVGEEFVYRKTISYTFGVAQGLKRKALGVRKLGPTPYLVVCAHSSKS